MLNPTSRSQESDAAGKVKKKGDVSTLGERPRAESKKIFDMPDLRPESGVVAECQALDANVLPACSYGRRGPSACMYLQRKSDT